MDNLEELESGIDSKNLLMQLIQVAPVTGVDLDDDQTTPNECDNSFSNGAMNNADPIIIDPFASFEQSNQKLESENFPNNGVTLSDLENIANSQSFEIIAAYPSTTGYYITSENGEQIYEIPPSNVTQQIIVNGNELFLLQDDQNFNENDYEAIMLQPGDYNKTTNNIPEFTINWPADQIAPPNANIQLILGTDNNLSHHESLLKVAHKPLKQTNYCSICDISFDTPKSYRRHMHIHEADKPFMCDSCEVKFNHHVNLMVHHAMEHYSSGQSNYECPICKKHFTRQASFFGHLRTHEIDEDMACTQCFRTFKTQVLLDYHYNEHKQEGYGPMPQYNSGFKCKLCPDVYLETIGMMRRHYTQCHPTVSRKKSLLVQPSSQLENTEPKVEAVVDVVSHSSSQNVESKSTMRKSKQKAKVYLNDIINAVKSTKRYSDSSRSLYAKKSKNNHSCSYCDKTFAKLCLLERHLVCHTKEKKFICNVCGKGFTQNSSLKTHLNIHYPNNHHECSICGKILRYKHTYRDHVCKQVNVNKRNQNGLTNTTSQQDRSRNNVLRSILVNKGQQQLVGNAKPTEKSTTFDVLNIYQLKKFVCNICRARFKNCNALKRHQQSHTSQSTHLCKLCHKVFKSKLIWKTHTSCHRLHPSNLCHHCNKFLPSKKHLQYHLKHPDYSLELEDIKIVDTNVLLSNPKPLIWDEHSHQLISVNNPTNISSNGIEEYPDRHNKCSKCHRSYKSMPHLTAHVKQCHENNKRVSCNRCNKSFCNDSTLNNHIRSKHLSCGYKCSVCPHQSSTPSLLKRHMKIHSYAKPFVCPICKKNFKTKSYCQAHIKNHTEQNSGESPIIDNNRADDSVPINTLFTTRQANDFTVESSYTVQSEVVPMMNYEITDLTSNYQALVGEDVFIDHHGLEQYGIQDVGSNLITINSDDTSQIKVNHIFNLVSQTDASNCNVDDSSQMEALPLHEDILNSEGCSILEAHALTIVKDHPESSARNQRLSRKCPLLMEALFKDESSEHKTVITTPKPIPKLETYYGCTKCDHVFVYSRDLVTHAKDVHIIDKPYTCSTCSKCFSSRIAVKVHEYKHKPSEDMKYHCPECYQEFANFLSITRHVVTFHSKERDLYKCTRCQSSYNNIRELRHHIDKHLSESETVTLDKTLIHKFVGNNTSVVFNDEQNEILANVIPTEEMTLSEKYLITAAKRKKYHWNATSQSKVTERNYQSLYSCKECHKSFARPSTLKRHSYVHSGLKPFACNQCSKSFKDNVNLKLHVENFHNSKRRVYICHVCSKRFVSKGGLKSHMSIHTNNLPFKCSKCDSAFRTEVLRDQHFQKRHSKNLLTAVPEDVCGNQNHQLFNALEFDPAISQMIYVDSIDDPPFQDNITEIVPFNGGKMDHIKPITELNINNNRNEMESSVAVATNALSTNNTTDIIIISNELGETSQFCFQSNSLPESSQASSSSKQFTNEIHTTDDDPTKKSELKWLCNICKQLFSIKKDYLSHECTHEFNDAALLSNTNIKTPPGKHNKRVHNLPSAQRLKCKDCSSTFAYRIELQKHVKSCHSIGESEEEKFPPTAVPCCQCQICDEQFHSDVELASHMSNHYQARAHNCKYCGRAFPNHQQLSQHQETHRV